MCNTDDLFTLLGCHSTPGDEDQVAAVLLRRLREMGWDTSVHGRHAISARLASHRTYRPDLLVCAHMDSPGYIVEKLDDDRVKLLELGSPSFEGDSVPVVLKTRSGEHDVELTRQTDDGIPGGSLLCLPRVGDVTYGDRACFRTNPTVSAGDVISSAFLDNRLGCFVLLQLADRARSGDFEANLVLGATGGEEFSGFGANVLAAAVRPAAVVCVDATYEDPGQSVRLGQGPVLTLSDTSALVAPVVRDRFLTFCSECQIPLQTEVYDVSGTDSRAFPRQGLASPVYPLLIPSTGNHSPVETACLGDVEHLIETTLALARNGDSSGLLQLGFRE